MARATKAPAVVEPEITGPLVLSSLSIHRAGEFHQRVVPGSNHCGPAEALVPSPLGGVAIPVKYELLVTCEPTLDHRGFLFDQVAVQAWMEERAARGPVTLSCETLVIELANAFQDKLARDARHCKLQGLSLFLSPAPHAAKVQVHLGRRTRLLDDHK